MSQTAKTVVAGVGGAIRGVVFFVAACLVLCAIPPIAISLSNRGTVDLDAFLPRATAPSSASAQVAIEGTPAQQQTIRRALDRLSWTADPSAYSIRVVTQGALSEGDMGTYVYPDSIIYVDERVVANPERENLAHILAHELGHMVDLQYMDDATRTWFMESRGLSAIDGWAASAAPWTARPQEDFAEVFATLDAPFSLWPIQTIGGRIREPEAMRQRIESCLPTPGRVERTFDASSLSSRAGELLSLVKSDPSMMQVLFGLAAFYICAFAIRSMSNQVQHARVTTKVRIRTIL